MNAYIAKRNGSWYTSRDGIRWYISSASRTAKDAEAHARGLWCAKVVTRTK